MIEIGQHILNSLFLHFMKISSAFLKVFHAHIHTDERAYREKVN
jgi:hypothetical protein